LPRNGEMLYIDSVIGNVPFDNRELFFWISSQAQFT
jgi:hypothetical protein